MGGLKRWNGTIWAPVKRWDGDSWNIVKVWNGTGWVPSPATASVVGSSYGLTPSSGSTTMSTTIPAGLVTGDRLYLAMMNTDTSLSTTITPTTTGWTVINPIADQGTCQRALYTAPWSAGLAGVVWTASAAGRRFGYVCVAVRNGRVAVTGLTDVASSTANVSFPSVTATGAGLVLRLAVRKDNISTGITAPGSSTTIVAQVGNAPGPAAHVGAWSQVVSGAGATGTASCTFTASSANGTGWSIAV